MKAKSPEIPERVMLSSNEACLHRLIEGQVRRAPDAPAVTCDGVTLTYAELDRRANQIANYLADHGVGPNSPVGLCLERSIDTVVCIVGVLKAGGAYVPMDPMNPADRLKLIIEDARCPVVIAHAAQRDRFENSDGTTILILDDADNALWGYGNDHQDRPCDGSNMAYIMYTSGSTGKPKGVPITHANVSRMFTATNHWFNITEDDTFALFHSYAFDLSVWEYCGALLYGGRVVVVPSIVSRSPEDLYKLLVDEKVTMLCQTPSAFRQLQYHEDGLPESEWCQLSLRCVVFCGEALSLPSLASWVERHGDEQPQLVNSYGITETTIFLTYRRIYEADTAPGTPSYIGVPFPDQPCIVLNEDLEPVPVGGEGELYVGGAGNSKGYLNRPELTAERFIKSPFPEIDEAILYKTGDLVRRLDDDLAYIGRIDTQVQIRGFRVELGEIEAKLGAHEAINGAVVRMREDEPGDARLVAYYLADAPLDSSVLRAYLSDLLPPYMIPSRYVHMEAFPLNTNGKIDSKALPAPGVAEVSKDYIAPRRECEAALAKLWEELLGAGQVGVDDSFFDLGGHSLLASQLIVRMEQQFSVRLPLRLVLENPTIAAHADAIESADRNLAPALGVLTAADREQAIPLSFAQERLWIIDQLQPGNATYNIPILFTITGRLDVDRLRAAFECVIQRHEPLRTLFTEGDPLASQAIQPSIEVPFDVVPLDGPTTDQEQTFRTRLTDTSRTPMALTTGPLLRFLYGDGDGECSYLGMIVHHAIFDGWSISVFLDDLAKSYVELESGGDGALPPLYPQYADYTCWQRGHADSDTIAAQLRYWRTQLAGPLTALELPTDYPRPAQQSWEGSIATGWIDAGLSESLSSLAKGHQKTLYAVLLSAWEILLHRYSGQTEILVGTVVAGRNHPDLEGLIGFFVNTVVLRNTVDSEMSFTQLLDAVESTSIGAQENQDVPFERVVAEVHPRRDPSRSPLFQVVFVLHNTPPYEVAISGASITGEEISNGGAKFDLTMAVQAREDRLQLSLEYNSALFAATTAERIVQNYTALLGSICAAPNEAVGNFEIVDDAERKALLEEGTGPIVALDAKQSLVQIFSGHASANPDAIAVFDGSNYITYGDLDQRSNRLAHLLIEHGVARGEGVPFYLSRNIHVVIAMLGTLKAGAAYVPLDLQDPPARRARVLAALGAQFILSEQACIDDLKGSGLELIALDDPDTLTSQPSETSRVSVEGQDLAYIIFTSGSTGEPKGVCCNHLGVINLFNDIQVRRPVGPGDRCSVWTAFSFDVSVYETWTALLAGARVDVVPEERRLDAVSCLEWMGERKITSAYLPGYMLHDLLDRQRSADALKLRRLLVGVEPLRISLLADIVVATPGLALINGYGPTEATVYATSYQVSPEDVSAPGNTPIGKPIANTRIYILDNKLGLVPDGIPGELCIGGPGLATCYYGDTALTSTQFIPDPFSTNPNDRLYRTGDLAFRRVDGELQFVRRIRQYVKLRGLRIEPGEIESILRQHGAVSEAAAMLWTDDGAEGRLIAYVLASKGKSIDEGTLAAYLEEELPPHMRPSQFVILTAFPRTVQGKLDRGALPAPPSPHHDEEGGLPQSDLEKRIASRWQFALGVDPIHVGSNFFDLGGHSLLAIQLLTRVNRDEGSALTLASFFDEPTIKGMASLIIREISQPVGDVAPTEQMEEIKSGTGVPFFCVKGAGDVGGSYDTFANALSEDQPFYGIADLEFADLENTTEPVTVEILARRCINEMFKVRPHGPYYLGGYSFGGIVAYEIARQLLEAGEEVPLIAMLDSGIPDHEEAPKGATIAYAIHMYNRIRARAIMLASTWKLLVGYGRDGVRVLLRRLMESPSPDVPRPFLGDYLRWIQLDTSVQYFLMQAGLVKPTIGERRLEMVEEQIIRHSTRSMVASKQALEVYELKPLPVTITLFRAEHNPWRTEKRDPTLGWSRYAEKGVNIVIVPGNHMVIIRRPYATDLGKALQRAIDAVQLESKPRID